MLRATMVVIALAMGAGCNFNDNNISLGERDSGTGPEDTGSTGADATYADTSSAPDVGSDSGAVDLGNAEDAGWGDTGVDAGADMSQMADMSEDMGPPESPCPDTKPTFGVSCQIEGLVCEYGEDPRDSCRPRATCLGGTWQVVTPRCTALPIVRCPNTWQDADGASCGTVDAYCEYDGLVCHCTDSGVAMNWDCDQPNTEPGCPEAMPHLGVACSEDAKVCMYECGPEGNRICMNGAWQADEALPCRF